MLSQARGSRMVGAQRARCDMNVAWIRLVGVPAAKDALRGAPVSIRPRPLGPIIRHVYLLAMASRSCSILTPSQTGHANSRRLMHNRAFGALFYQILRAQPATNLLGTTITTRSMASGTSRTEE